MLGASEYSVLNARNTAGYVHSLVRRAKREKTSVLPIIYDLCSKPDNFSRTPGKTQMQALLEKYRKA